MTIELFDLNGVPLAIARAIVLASGAVIWTLVLVRLVGLRSFAKMTSFDFVATVATKSLDQVRAVVLETTGDLSVLTGESLDMRLLAGVRGVPGDGLAVSRMGDDPV